MTENVENTIICDDNMAAMAKMEANSIDTIITEKRK